MKVHVDTKQMSLFECLSSATRIKALEILENGPKNVGELAGMLGVSSAIMTRHVSKLQETGLIHTENISGKRGIQKMCSLIADEIILSFKKDITSSNYFAVSIPVGQYSAYEIMPTCGLASVDGRIGIMDDPRYFSDPAHVNASILWFGSGSIEYRIPSYTVSSQPIKSIEISLEICSEFPMSNANWPSDIYFYLNDVPVGMWQCPGDFGGKRGIYTPMWWKDANTQYGLLKTIRITEEKSMLDGVKLSDITLEDLAIKQGKDLTFRIACPKDSRNPGGVNILGKGFGNYDQDIEVRVEYE